MPKMSWVDMTRCTRLSIVSGLLHQFVHGGKRASAMDQIGITLENGDLTPDKEINAINGHIFSRLLGSHPSMLERDIIHRDL